MAKKILINEKQMKFIMAEGMVREMTEAEVDRRISHALKNDKELEKRVKKIVADAVNTLFKTLWQRSNFYENEIKK